MTGEEIDFWWGESNGLMGRVFRVRGDEQIFGWLGDSPDVYYAYTYIKELHRQVFLYNKEAPCTSHTSCVQVAILLLQDLSIFCVTDIYVVYIFACLFSVCNTINLSCHKYV